MTSFFGLNYLVYFIILKKVSNVRSFDQAKSTLQCEANCLEKGIFLATIWLMLESKRRKDIIELLGHHIS